MPAYKDKKTGKWYASFYCTNWKGVREKKMKRGFETKKAALEWEREFLRQSTADLDMRFETFVGLYVSDLKQRLRENTFITKENIIYKKILPFFKDKKMNAITAKDVIKWQNELLAYRDENGKPYSKTYLKTIHNQLSAIFNHAIRYYDLKSNPAAKAGHIGEKEAGEMEFWTKEEYQKFADAIMGKPKSFYAFEVLYWCGIRVGELLALTPGDFDFENGLLRINKSYQRIGKRDVITEPKTKKSIRTIKMPNFLCEEIKEYLNMLYGIKPNDRMFVVTKSFLHHEMDRGSKAAGVKRIKIHGLRHSHISHLIDLGFSAVAIADRVGHESIDITYRYAHLFPSKQVDMANKLDEERGNLLG
ncbi:MAG: site-specific integrase [Clostridiales bacterium]|nr:site-specific integrase [Clostridiales bacterium]